MKDEAAYREYFQSVPISLQQRMEGNTPTDDKTTLKLTHSFESAKVNVTQIIQIGNVNWREIIAENKLVFPSRISPGQL